MTEQTTSLSKNRPEQYSAKVFPREILARENIVAINLYRIHNGYTQVQIGGKMGRDAAWACRLFKHGIKPSLEMQQKLCKLLNMPMLVFTDDVETIIKNFNDREKKRGRPRLILQKNSQKAQNLLTGEITHATKNELE